MLRLRVCAFALILALLCLQGVRAEGFLKGDDLWVCTGDSITHADTYRRTLGRVIAHFHPEADIRVVNTGKWGALVTAADEEFRKASEKERPSIVSIMSAMNSSINSGWQRGQSMDPYVKSYVDGLRSMVRSAKQKNITVIVMSPTLTDNGENYGSSWDLAGTREFLQKCTELTKQLAVDEGVLYLPVSEEMELVQDTLPPQQVLRPDGVHPSAFGEYVMAGTFFRHIDLAGPLDGIRKLNAEPTPELPVKMSLTSRFLLPGERKIGFNIESPAPAAVTATWSCGKARGTQVLQLTGHDTWEVELPQEVAAMQNGDADDVVIDLTDGSARNIYIVDLCRTRVMHLKDGKVSGVLRSEEKRPEGKVAAKWQMSVVDKGLMFEAEAFDSEIRDDFDWPWGRDGMTLYLDYRLTERFADIGLDSDVHQDVLSVTDKPKFGVSLVPWLGRGMPRAATVGGDKTPTGYKVWMYIHYPFSMYYDSDLSKRDFIGFNVVHGDLDSSPDRKTKLVFTQSQNTKYAPHQYANSMVILDLKDKFKSDSLINVDLSKL